MSHIEVRQHAWVKIEILFDCSEEFIFEKNDTVVNH